MSRDVERGADYGGPVTWKGVQIMGGLERPLMIGFWSEECTEHRSASAVLHDLPPRCHTMLSMFCYAAITTARPLQFGFAGLQLTPASACLMAEPPIRASVVSLPLASGMCCDR
eukprot:2358299-Rhodomonas_salina.1